MTLYHVNLLFHSVILRLLLSVSSGDSITKSSSGGTCVSHSSPNSENEID